MVTTSYIIIIGCYWYIIIKMLANRDRVHHTKYPGWESNPALFINPQHVPILDCTIAVLKSAGHNLFTKAEE